MGDQKSVIDTLLVSFEQGKDFEWSSALYHRPEQPVPVESSVLIRSEYILSHPKKNAILIC